MRLSHLAVAVILLAGGTAPGASRHYQARDVRVPVFARGEREIAGVIHVEKICPGLQRRGVFRIGFLPAVILDKVRIEIKRPECTSEVLGRLLRMGRRVDPPEAIELREVRLFQAGHLQPTLEAGTVLIEARGAWRLRNGICFRTADSTIQSRAAELEMGENGALRLTIETASGMRQFDLISSANTNRSKSATP